MAGLPEVLVRRWQGAVVSWEEEHGRDFPWRHDRTPYRVLVAEVLLKRTTSTAAARKYAEFLERWPDPRALAAARLPDLVEFFRGIGLYNQRAKLAKEMAKVLVAEFGGEVPCDLGALLRVPGVGRYTADAVLSFGCGIPRAVVDSNVERVLRRAFGVEKKAELYQLAQLLVPTEKHDVYNYGMLDLGATVCSYRGPKCADCPVARLCMRASHEVFTEQ